MLQIILFGKYEHRRARLLIKWKNFSFMSKICMFNNSQRISGAQFWCKWLTAENLQKLGFGEGMKLIGFQNWWWKEKLLCIQSIIFSSPTQTVWLYFDEKKWCSFQHITVQQASTIYVDNWSVKLSNRYREQHPSTKR